MIELASIFKTYQTKHGPVPVLSDISLSVDKGEYVAFMGPSGTGKTTLMNILGCLDKPSSGTYTLEGINVTGLSDSALSAIRNEKIGFVFQLFHLLPRLSIVDNVTLPFLYSKEYPSDASERALKLLEQVGLSDRIRHTPNTLSGGQQQRVAIARALVNHPLLLLADEPTGNLDSAASEEILGVFHTLSELGKTIVVVTHNDEVAGRCQRVIRMQEGRIVEDRRT